MSRSILAFLLGLSVLFNVFFIVGAMTWRVDDAGDQSEVTEVADFLSLDTRQVDAFREMREEFKTHAVVLGQQLRRIRSLIAEELASEYPDIAKLQRMTEQEAALQAERHAFGINQFADFIEILSREQKRQLGHRLMGPPEKHRPPEEIERMAIERFDQDDDGLLNEEERKAAREFARQTHEARKKHRRELHQRFDIDGDGRLSPDEQEALREHMLEQRAKRKGDRRNRGHRPPPHERQNRPPQHGPPTDHFPPGI